MGRGAALLYPIFFASGAAALIFEALWFRVAGLALGNSVTAGALVLASFMAGLGLGNAWAARVGDRLRRPVALYALLEVAVGLAGIALVLGLPGAAPWVSAALEPFGVSSWLLRAARFGFAFALLVVPATAMGATLPLLVRALAHRSEAFGRTLGRLYGVNTLGAVAGAASAELLWIPLLGIRGSAWLAGALLAGVALLSLAVSARLDADLPVADDDATRRGRSIGWGGASLLAASFLSGGLLLGLELLWFRLLQLFVIPSSANFALMLAVVLAGIGVGGLAGSLLLRIRPRAAESAAAWALAAGVATLAGFWIFPRLAQAGLVTQTPQMLLLFGQLMLPTCLISGVLFTLLGERLHERLGSDSRSAGLLTLANTLGSMLGPLLVGFALLPRLGLEASLLLATLGYLGVAALAFGGLETLRSHPRVHALSVAVFAIAATAYPQGQVFELVEARLVSSLPRERLVALREEKHQLVAYLRAEFLGEPRYHRLHTGNVSMSASDIYARRYMELFSVLALAFHAGPRDALLISYGVGNTARAMTAQAEFERIDVVDTSRATLELAGVPFDPEPSPLADPRVRVHLEDGRHFLLTSRSQYDLITGEPPPPATAGVVNLYTREYFELMRARLRPGGIATYWLPVLQFHPPEARSITRAFCEAFPDCSLWEGGYGDWILMGSADGVAPLEEAQVRRQWTDPAVAPGLREIGLERPEQLAATFLADAEFLTKWVSRTPPLVDDRPARAPVWRGEANPTRVHADYAELQSRARAQFEASAFLARVWPASFRSASLEFFDYQELARWYSGPLGSPAPLGRIHRVLTRSDLVTLPLWMLGSDADKQRIARGLDERGRSHPEIDYELGLGALARRDYREAARRLDFEGLPTATDPRARYGAYARCMAGECDEVLARLQSPRAQMKVDASFRSFVKQTFGTREP